MGSLPGVVALCAAMQADAPPDGQGLSRRLPVRLPFAALAAAIDARLAALAPAAAAQAAAGETAEAAARRLFAAGLASELFEAAVREFTAALPGRLGLRLAAPPRIDGLARTAEGDIRFDLAFEIAPDPPPGAALPDPARLDPIEQLIAEPGEAEIAARLEERAATRASFAPLPPDRPARPGEFVLCDVLAELPPNLLRNPGATGALPGDLGTPPTHWDPRATEGMRLAILGPSAEDGIPCLDLRVTGAPPGKGTIVVFLEQPNAINVRPGDTLTLSAHWRLLAGSVPERAACEAFLNQRSERDFLKAAAARVPPPGPDALAAQGFRRTLTMDAGPEVAHARPGLLIRLAPGTTGPIDLTLRIGRPRLHLGAEEPPAEPFPEASATGLAVEVAGPGFLPGLAERLEGIRAGETRTVTTFLPRLDAPRGLAGRELRLVVTARGLQRRIVPPVDEALALALGFLDLDALRRHVQAELRERYAAMSVRRLRSDLLRRLAEAAELPVPETRIAAELTRLRQRAAARAAEGGDAFPPMDEARLRAIAERRVRIGLILDAVARAEAIVVPDSALEAAMDREAARHPGREAEMLAHLRANPESREPLRASLLEARVTDHLLARARVVRRRVPPAVLMDWEAESTWG